MFSNRNNLFIVLAVALIGLPISLASSQKDEPRDNRWFKSLRSPLPQVSDAEKKDSDAKKTTAKKSEPPVSDAEKKDSDAKKTTAKKSQSSGWGLNMTHNLTMDDEMGQKIQAAAEQAAKIAESVKGMAARFFRQNEIRTFMRYLQGQLASIIKSAEEEKPTLALIFTQPKSDREQKRDQNAASVASLTDNTPDYLQTSMEPFYKWQQTFVSRLLTFNSTEEFAQDKELAEVLKELAQLSVESESKARSAKSHSEYVNSLKALSNQLNAITQNFMNLSLLGGLLDTFTEVVNNLGKTLDKVVINLSSDLSKQLKIQLNEVVGYAALVKVAEKLNGIVQNKQSSPADILHELATVKSEIQSLTDLVKQGNKIQTDDKTKKTIEDKGDLQKALEEISSQIESIHNEYSQVSMSHNDSTRAALINKVNSIKNKTNSVLNRHGGLAVTLRDTIDRLNNDLDKVLDRNIKQLNTGFDSSLDRNIKQLNTGVDKSLKKFVVNACLGAVAVYSSIFLMNHWRNPVDRKIGLGTLAGSLICMPIINKLVNWFNK